MISLIKYWSVRRVSIFLSYMLFMSFCCAPSCLKGQSISGVNKVLIIGQVTNNQNGGPVKYQEVFIASDSIYEPQSNYFKKVLTDHEGYYYDTIFTKYEKGAFFVSTKDYLNNQYDTTVYYRFTWGADNVLFPNFVIPIKPLPVFYQANFYYLRNPGGQNEKEYQFYDITDAENIISWFWEFGDGGFSNQQHPLHTYDQTGLFRVKLTVEILDTPGSQAYLTQIVKVIHVTVEEYFHFGGHVFAGYFPIDFGEAFLYKIEESKLTPIDTAVFNSQLGHYYFYQLIEGEYIVKADLAPNSVLYNQFMTTYYSDKLHWINADTIFHHSTNFNYHINLVPNIQTMTGPGSISGIISYGSGEKEKMPACNMSIFLYDLEENPVFFCHSDDNGHFEFSGVELGYYLLYAEVTGKNTIPLLITLDELNTHVSQVELTIEFDEVYGSIAYAGIENQAIFQGVSLPYPNPATSVVSIDALLSGKTSFTISVADNSGKLVIHQNKSGEMGWNTFNLDISDLPSGLYFILINNNGQTTTRKFVK
ncbi:MAG: T9SS type A sorting domain-containing protein [Bacteroidales bacterium]